MPEPTATKDRSAPDPMAAMQHPLLSRSGLGTIAGIIGALWLIAAVSGNTVVTVLIAVLTVAILGGLGWVWRLSRSQRNVMTLLQSGATSPEARKLALAQLQASDKGGKDVLNRIARAQLEAQEDPDQALATLEGIDLDKVPGPAADEVRTLRAQMCLFKNRIKDARVLVDDIKLSNAGNAQSRAMMVAVVAEAWARSGKHEAAVNLLADIKLEDPEVAPVKVLLLMARAFAHFADGKRERARKDLENLMKIDLNLLGRFVKPGPGIHLELQRLTQDVMRTHPDVRRMARNQGPQGGGGGGFRRGR